MPSNPAYSPIEVKQEDARIIGKIAQQENFSMIFDKTGIVYAKPHLDMTNELIRRYNSGEGAEGGGGAKPATPPAKAPGPPKK